jgi:hypothetical protein
MELLWLISKAADLHDAYVKRILEVPVKILSRKRIDQVAAARPCQRRSNHAATERGNPIDVSRLL